MLRMTENRNQQLESIRIFFKLLRDEREHAILDDGSESVGLLLPLP